MFRKWGILVLTGTLLYSDFLFGNINKDLISAVVKGNLQEVQALIEKGAKVDTKYDKGKTPLHWACVNNNLKIVAYLISKGADVNAKDDNLATPLHLSAIKRNLDIVKYLILKGADINALDKYGWTPLHYFSFYENSLGVKYLVMEEASITNTSVKEYMGIATNSTALDIALIKNYSNIIIALENPDKYRLLSRKPFLEISASNILGDENLLIAPAKAFIQLTIENKGGFWASNVAVTVEKLSNCDGLEIGNIPETNIDARDKIEYLLPVEAERNTKDGMAIIKFTAKETNFFRESTPVIVEIPTLSVQPPLLSINSIIKTKELNKINAEEHGEISIDLKNSGRGYAENTRIFVSLLSNCQGLIFSQLSNILLPPKYSTNLSLKFDSAEDLKNGKAGFLVIAEDMIMHNSVTNILSIETGKLLRPLLTAGAFLNPVIIETFITDFISNINTNRDSNETDIITNLNNEWITNLKPNILIKNLGETNAYNVVINITINGSILEKDKAQYDKSRKISGYNWITNYIIADIPINKEVKLELPVTIVIDDENTNISFNVSGFDEKKRSSFQTNIIINPEFSSNDNIE